MRGAEGGGGEGAGGEKAAEGALYLEGREKGRED